VIRHLVQAARPRTLPAAVAPVMVGTAAADRALVQVSVLRLALALIVALSLQVAVNYANDLFDGLKGVDGPARTGPRRVVASGLVAPRTMAVATASALVVAAVAGVALAALVSWWLVGIGAAAIVAALGYSGGRRPYASRGLGEVSVFVFFGVVATVGSQFVQDGRIVALAVVAAVPVGLIAVALLVVNNLRDIPTDAATGKRTLAVRLGDRGTRTLYAALLAGAVAGTAAVAAAAGSAWPFLAVVATPLATTAGRAVRRGAQGRALVGVLEATGRFQLVYALLLAAGLVVAGWPAAGGAE
jgi:1,4-dihydroxy-2-naphthoate polyprenyltransferase